eukprot:Amastigsp_a843246_30.p4 type:complete len:127 gc:universal Amastigsp_a843246_30:908-528(-)
MTTLRRPSPHSSSLCATGPRKARPNATPRTSPSSTLYALGFRAHTLTAAAHAAAEKQAKVAPRALTRSGSACVSLSPARGSGVLSLSSRASATPRRATSSRITCFSRRSLCSTRSTLHGQWWCTHS